jgi:hypothetical protein
MGWKLNIQQKDIHASKALLFTFKKETSFSSCIILRNKKELSKNEIEEIKKSVPANEYYFASPDQYGEKDIIYLSIFDIDSFRRIQQILLRGMIYSDGERNICPFCGGTFEEKDGSFECRVCRARISEDLCPVTNERYYLSSIIKYQTSSTNMKEQFERRRFLHDRFAEAQLHFRNITAITSDGEPICPKCGKVHT